MSFQMPEQWEVVNPITEEECSSLEQNTGIDPSEGLQDCEAIALEILPLIEDELRWIRSGVKTIFANEDSKCKDTDKNPTLASILSRIYRLSQAISCAICTYDPALVTRLKTGSASQVLWGQGVGNLPLWRTPDTVPTEDSTNLVYSGGVYNAIRAAQLGTFHVWEGHSEFDYYAEDIDSLNSQTGASNDDTALVLTGAGGMNQLYTRTNGSWMAGTVYGAIENFATTHILKGTLADKEIYFYYNEDQTQGAWNTLNAGLGNITAQIADLRNIADMTVQSQSGNDKMILTVKDTLAEANAVQPTAGKTTIVLISGDS